MLAAAKVVDVAHSSAGENAKRVNRPACQQIFWKQTVMELILPLESDLLPVVNRTYWEQINKDLAMQVDERARCSVEPWYWLCNYVYTIRKDENVEGGVLTRFPADEYLQYTFHKFFTEPLFASDKSRQMRLTLLLMSYAVWKCQFRLHEEIICQTKKEEDADRELIKTRAWVIHKYQPSWLKPPAVYSYRKLKFPTTDSIILGIPKGADQIRSHNPTTVILDEGGFFEGEFEECRTAALACCKDIKCVSTANGGEWEDFVEKDKIVA